mmetsp:Transcript_33674/g.49113  ORF Transcript_33674/g.49113 Transcript_33674/m.49113 type:complete len:254 (+) Transcript_33674:105-866(+)
MHDLETYNLLVKAWIGVAVLVFVVSQKITHPYGRHSKTTWGPMVDNRWGWFLMEMPVLIIFPLLFFLGNAEKSGPSYFLLVIYVLHYIHRALIYPWRLNTNGKKMPLLIMFSAVIFNFINASLLGYYFGFLGPKYPSTWFYSTRFMCGTVVFFAGVYINFRSDTILINLRKPGEKGYKIPKGFLFEYVSCPNHFGEITQWIGYSILSLSLPAACFAIWTAANLTPRAFDHHEWYQQKFPEYPKERKALIPLMI